MLLRGLWFQKLSAEVGLEPARAGERTFSKFLAASRAVHGGG